MESACLLPIFFFLQQQQQLLVRVKVCRVVALPFTLSSNDSKNALARRETSRMAASRADSRTCRQIMWLNPESWLTAGEPRRVKCYLRGSFAARKNVITNIFHETAQPAKGWKTEVLFNICATQSFWSTQPENTSSKRLPTVSLALTCATSAPVYSAACFPAECITPRHAYCSALLHSLWSRVAFPPSWQHLFGRRAAAWVSLSDGANESHVTPGRGAGELRRVKVNQGKIMLKRASEWVFQQLPPAS